jgi:hypothetical protein
MPSLQAGVNVKTRALPGPLQRSTRPRGIDLFDRNAPVTRIVLLIILAFVSGDGAALGQQASASPAKPTAAPTPVPLAAVPSEAQAALASLQEIEADVSKDQSSADTIARAFLDLKGEIDSRNR